MGLHFALPDTITGAVVFTLGAAQYDHNGEKDGRTAVVSTLSAVQYDYNGEEDGRSPVVVTLGLAQYDYNGTLRGGSAGGAYRQDLEDSVRPSCQATLRH